MKFIWIGLHHIFCKPVKIILTIKFNLGWHVRSNELVMPFSEARDSLILWILFHNRTEYALFGWLIITIMIEMYAYHKEVLPQHHLTKWDWLVIWKLLTSKDYTRRPCSIYMYASVNWTSNHSDHCLSALSWKAITYSKCWLIMNIAFFIQASVYL